MNYANALKYIQLCAYCNINKIKLFSELNKIPETTDVKLEYKNLNADMDNYFSKKTCDNDCTSKDIDQYLSRLTKINNSLLKLMNDKKVSFKTTNIFKRFWNFIMGKIDIAKGKSNRNNFYKPPKSEKTELKDQSLCARSFLARSVYE